MGAKKDRDLKVLDHRAKKFKQKVAEMKKCGISQKKIDKMEEKQARYELWLEEVEQTGDY